MKYIVFDLEWNQSSCGLEPEAKELPFEIIDIGAVKCDEDGTILDTFSELINPSVYRRMHRVTGELLHLTMKDLMHARPFTEVSQRFLRWCGEEEYVFCAWGTLDLTHLQRNLEFFEMDPIADGPIAYLDLQKIFGKCYEKDQKVQRSLEYAIDFLGLEKDAPFHRAAADAYYTALVLGVIAKENPGLFHYVSYDLYHPPVDKKHEIKITFETYSKYISRAFDTKSEAMADREVCSTRCFYCNKALRKKIKWFSVAARHYYSLSHCPVHGFLKGKIRMQHYGNQVYVVKTLRFITPEEIEDLMAKKEHAKEQRRKKEKRERENRKAAKAAKIKTEAP